MPAPLAAAIAPTAIAGGTALLGSLLQLQAARKQRQQQAELEGTRAEMQGASQAAQSLVGGQQRALEQALAGYSRALG